MHIGFNLVQLTRNLGFLNVRNYGFFERIKIVNCSIKFLKFNGSIVISFFLLLWLQRMDDAFGLRHVGSSHARKSELSYTDVAQCPYSGDFDWGWRYQYICMWFRPKNVLTLHRKPNCHKLWKRILFFSPLGTGPALFWTQKVCTTVGGSKTFLVMFRIYSSRQTMLSYSIWRTVLVGKHIDT